MDTTAWLFGFLFLVSFVAYVSFSLVAQEALGYVNLPAERRKEAYQLAPLSLLCPDIERLVLLLNFSRLLFAIPVLLLAYKWTFGAGTFPVIITLISWTLLLYLLPDWLLRLGSLSVFRRIVQVIAYMLYPAFWLLVALPPLKSREFNRDEKPANGEPHEAESEEFKGDILKAVSMIGETTVREVMTPRVDMVCIAVTASLSQLLQFFKDNKFSRLPVFKERIDNIVGIVSIMDLIDSLPGSDLS
ncbi:MAG TPA: CBS domain-containing protein, partial [Acidobacteriota bacterium]